MPEFEIKGIVQEKDIPNSEGGSRADYDSIWEQWNRISTGASIHVQSTKKHLGHGISRYLERKVGKSAFKITTRTNKKNDVVDFYIIRKK